MQIELYSKLQDPVGAIQTLGAIVAKGMMKAACVEQGMAAVFIGVCEDKNPAQVLRTYHFYPDGSFSKKALAALAEFRQVGGKHKWIKTGDEPTAKPEDRYAEGLFTAPDGEQCTYRYSMADAVTEQVVRPNSRWTKRPGNMLRARCISNAMGILMPEIYAGPDAESDEVTASAPKLLLDPVAAPEPEKPPTTIDVQPEPESKTSPKSDEAELAKQGLAPSQPEAPQSAAPGAATEAELKELESAIGSFAPVALAFLRKSGMINATQGFEHLTSKQVRRIIRFKDSFRIQAENSAKDAQ